MKNDDFSLINQLYKPYKYTRKGKIVILHSSDGAFILKPKNTNLNKTRSYLDSCGFNNYIKPVDKNIHTSYDVYPKVEDLSASNEQKAHNLCRVVGLLHSKTSCFKDVDQNKYDNIYNDINETLIYLENYYSDLYDEIFPREYFNPFEELFMDYYSKINNVIYFGKNELENWYSMVADKKNTRVSVVHNNLEIDHLIKSDDDYLISFDNAIIDTPVLDLVKFYKKEYIKIDFSSWFKEYLYYNHLSDDELKLFFILVSIPDEIKITSSNIDNVTQITKLINYINKTEDLIRPYYAKNEVEE